MDQATAPQRRALLILTLSVLVTASSGCATSLRGWVQKGFKVGPEYRRPGAPLELQWIDMQGDPRLVPESPNLASWWQLLGDPTLNGLIETAYRQNLTVREAGTRIQQAAAIRGVAVGNLFPQLQQAVGDYQRIQTSRNVAVPSPVRWFSQHDLGLQAGWELDFWGRFRRSVAVADANLGASVAAYDEVIVLLLANVASAYVEIRTAQERLHIARTIVGLQQGSLAIAQARFQGGQTNKLDVIQAQNNIDVTEAAIPQLEAQLRMANNRLCVLLGLPPHDLASQFAAAPIPAVSRYVQVGIPADLLRRRPDIRRAERLMRAQSERIGIAEAELYPHISLAGSIEWQAEDFDDLFNPDSVFALISPGFTWNILNYGRLSNGIEVERQRFRETVYSYQQKVLTAQQEVEDGIVGFLKEQDRADQLAQAVAQVNEAEQIAVTLYETGATDFNRVFLIQAFQFSQQDDLVVSRAAVVLNLIQIYKALGGGWEIRCPNRAPSVPIHVEGEYANTPIGAIPNMNGEATRPGPNPQPGGKKTEELPRPQPAPDQIDKRLQELLEKARRGEQTDQNNGPRPGSPNR